MHSGRPNFFIHYLKIYQDALLNEFKKDSARRSPDQMLFFLYATSESLSPWKKLLLTHLRNRSLLPIDPTVLNKLRTVYEKAGEYLTVETLEPLIDSITETGFFELFEREENGERIKIRSDIALYLESTFGDTAYIKDEIFLMRAYTQVIWNTLIKSIFEENSKTENPRDFNATERYFTQKSIDGYFVERLKQLKKSAITYKAVQKEPSAATPLCKCDLAGAVSATVVFSLISLLQGPLWLLFLIPVGGYLLSKHLGFFNKQTFGSSAVPISPEASASTTFRQTTM